MSRQQQAFRVILLDGQVKRVHGVTELHNNGTENGDAQEQPDGRVQV